MLSYGTSGLQLPCREEEMPEKAYQGVPGVPFLDLGEVTQGSLCVYSPSCSTL